MRITKESLKESIENLSSRIEGITGENPKYTLATGDARLGKVYSIKTENNSTICSFMVAKELDAYIWGMYKAFAVLGK